MHAKIWVALSMPTVSADPMASRHVATLQVKHGCRPIGLCAHEAHIPTGRHYLIGIHQKPPESIGIYWNALGSIGIHRNELESIGIL